MLIDWKVNCLIKMYIQKLFNIFFKEINRKYCYNASMWAVQSYYMYIQEIWFTLLSSSCTTLLIISHIIHAQIKKIFPGGVRRLFEFSRGVRGFFLGGGGGLDPPDPSLLIRACHVTHWYTWTCRLNSFLNH